MKAKKRSATPMEKLKELLDDWKFQETPGARRMAKKYPPFVFISLKSIYQYLERGQGCCFLTDNIKEILESCGFKVQNDGVGWRVLPATED